MNILNGNYAKAVNYFTGVVVNEVLSFPGNAFVYPSNNFAAFLSFECPFFGLRQLSLCFS